MTKVVAAGLVLVIAVQAFAFTQLERELVVAVTGGAIACVLCAVLARLDHEAAVEQDTVDDDAAAAVRRWLTRTETLISWSESTRADWDRRLRPMLARQFELAAGRRKGKDARSFQSTGRMVFGDELWQWVDPDNIARSGGPEPGPGRRTLDDILARLERL